MIKRPHCNHWVAVITSILSFSLLQAFLFISPIGSPFSTSPITTYALIIESVYFLIFAAASYLRNTDGRQYAFFTIVLLFFPSLAANFGLASHSSSLHFLLILGFHLQLAALIVLWIHTFMSYTFETVTLILLLGFALSYFEQFFIITYNLQHELTFRVIFYCLVIVGAVGSYFISRSMGVKTKSTVSDEPLEYSYVKVRRVLVGVVLVAFIYGLLFELDNLGNFPVYNQTKQIAFVLGLVSIIIAVIFPLIQKNFDSEYLYPGVSVLVACILLYRSTTYYNYSLAIMMMTGILQLYQLLVWSVFLKESFNRKLPYVFLMCSSFGLIRLAQAIGSLVSDALFSKYVPLYSQGISFVFDVVLVFIIVSLLVYILDFARSTQKYLEFASKQNFQYVQNPSELEFIDFDELNTIILKSELTPRETEIIREYALGKSAKTIAEDLEVSEHTVKTHIRNAYKKMDINSKQDLISHLRSLN